MLISLPGILVMEAQIDGEEIMKLEDISYLSEPVEDYIKAIDAAKNKSELLKAIEPYELIAWDALDKVKRFSDAEFAEYKKWRSLEKKGIFAGEKLALKFCMIPMPENMFRVSVVGVEFGAPWGCAFIRLKEVGKIEIKDGRAYVRP